MDQDAGCWQPTPFSNHELVLQIWDGICSAQTACSCPIIMTQEYLNFAQQVMTSHDRANKQAEMDVSPAIGDMLTEMQGCSAHPRNESRITRQYANNVRT